MTDPNFAAGLGGALAFTGALLGTVGLVVTWSRLRQTWRDNWPAEDISPAFTEFRARLYRIWRRVFGRWMKPQVISGEMHVTFGSAVALASGNAAAFGVGGRTVKERLAAVEDYSRSVSRRIDTEIASLRDALERQLGSLSEDAQAERAAAAEDAREQLRIALGWPAAMIFVGAALQAVGAALQVFPGG